MDKFATDVTRYLQTEFKKLADPVKAGPMAAYMKTEMPFYGIQKPDRVPVYKQLKKLYTPATRKEYESAVKALWALPHREEKYAAIDFARQHKTFVTSESLPLYETLIRQGAWWDFVDDIAINLVGDVLLKERVNTREIMDDWIDDDDMWIRRTALIAHNHHRKQTDAKQLFAHCLRRCGESEFFIRKGIGWALREYSYAAPGDVKKFLLKNKDDLSPLSFREGAKQLIRSGQMK
jgi:3-methyladenine DNA glycosylase AlkD